MRGTAIGSADKSDKWAIRRGRPAGVRIRRFFLGACPATLWRLLRGGEGFAEGAAGGAGAVHQVAGVDAIGEEGEAELEIGGDVLERDDVDAEHLLGASPRCRDLGYGGDEVGVLLAHGQAERTAEIGRPDEE